MDRVDHLSLDELHDLLDGTEGNLPTQRVLAAIGRKQGATLEELANRHNVAEKTIRNWLIDSPISRSLTLRTTMTGLAGQRSFRMRRGCLHR